MYNIQKLAEQKNDLQFDEVFNNLKLKYQNVMEIYSTTKKTNYVISELTNLKFQLCALSTKNAFRCQAKKEFHIKLCEQLICLCINENKPKEAMTNINDLELNHFTEKEIDTKILFYKARCCLLQKDFEQAFNYYKRARNFVDGDLKDEIDLVLKKIKKQGTFDDISLEVNGSEKNNFDLPSCCSTNSINNLDIKLIPLVDSNDTKLIESYDIQKKHTKLEKKANPKVPKAQNLEAIEICILKSASTILSEFMTKFVDTTPMYKTDDEVKQQGNNSKVFTISCYCIGHTETGCGLNKKTAKEVASQKMIKYFENIGKLKLKEAAEE